MIVNSNHINLEGLKPVYNRKTAFEVLDVEDSQVSDLSLLYKIVYGYLCFKLRDYAEYLMRRYHNQQSQLLKERETTNGFVGGLILGGLAVAAVSIGIIIVQSNKGNAPR